MISHNQAKKTKARQEGNKSSVLFYLLVFVGVGGHFSPSVLRREVMKSERWSQEEFPLKSFQKSANITLILGKFGKSKFCQ